MSNKTEFANKIVLITGAAQGVGYAAAMQFAQAGASVAMIDVQDNIMERAESVAAAHGVRTMGLKVDLRSKDQVKSAVSKVAAEFGGVDVAVNVAGIFPLMAFEAQDEEDLATVMDVNFFGVIRICQAVVPIMRKRKGCSIINIISGAAFVPMYGYTAYCASKAAVLGASRTLATELAPQIRVNMVSPGVTTSETILAAMGGAGPAMEEHFLSRIPMGKFATPDNIAHAIVFLASPEKAGHITGATFQVNGGMLMS